MEQITTKTNKFTLTANQIKTLQNFIENNDYISDYVSNEILPKINNNDVIYDDLLNLLLNYIDNHNWFTGNDKILSYERSMSSPDLYVYLERVYTITDKISITEYITVTSKSKMESITDYEITIL